MTTLQLNEKHSFSQFDLEILTPLVGTEVTLPQLAELDCSIALHSYDKEKDVVVIDHPYAY